MCFVVRIGDVLWTTSDDYYLSRLSATHDILDLWISFCHKIPFYYIHKDIEII